MRPEADRSPQRLHAARVIALTAAAWLQGVALAQPYWDPFASPEIGEARDAPQAVAAPAPGPVDEDTIARLLGEAETAYAAGRWPQAMEAFKAVTAFDAGNAQAWLRIGNLHHRRGQLLAAASAYRKAAGPPAGKSQTASQGRKPAAPSDRGDATPVRQETAATFELRTKALVNLASVNLELALAALDEADAVMAAGGTVPKPLRDAHGDARSEAGVLANRIDELGLDRGMQPRAQPGAQDGTRPVVQTGNRGRGQPARSPSALPAPAAASARAPAPAAASDAMRPTIEYLRGAPRP